MHKELIEGGAGERWSGRGGSGFDAGLLYERWPMGEGNRGVQPFMHALGNRSRTFCKTWTLEKKEQDAKSHVNAEPDNRELVSRLARSMLLKRARILERTNTNGTTTCVCIPRDIGVI